MFGISMCRMLVCVCVCGGLVPIHKIFVGNRLIFGIWPTPHKYLETFLGNDFSDQCMYGMCIYIYVYVHIYMYMCVSIPSEFFRDWIRNWGQRRKDKRKDEQCNDLDSKRVWGPHTAERAQRHFGLILWAFSRSTKPQLCSSKLRLSDWAEYGFGVYGFWVLTELWGENSVSSSWGNINVPK